MFQYFKFYKPGLGQSWLLMALVLVGSVLGAGITMAWKGAPQSLTYAFMMAIPIAWCWWMGQRSAESGIRPLAVNQPHFGRLPAWAFLVLVAVAMLSLSVVIEPTTSFIPMPDGIRAIFEKAFVDSTLPDMIVSVCILAPLLEEFLCRGMMLRGMLSHGMSPGKAIFWSALIFAVMHLNPWQSIPAFLIGLLLGWVYWRTHCLWATIFLHCLNNTISTVVSRVWPDLPVDAGLKDVLPATTYWIIYAAAAVLLLILLYFLHEKTVSPKVPSPVDA